MLSSLKILGATAVVSAIAPIASAAVTYSVKATVPAELQGIETIISLALYGDTSAPGQHDLTAKIFNLDTNSTNVLPGAMYGIVGGDILALEPILTTEDVNTSYSQIDAVMTLGSEFSFDVTLDGEQLTGLGNIPYFAGFSVYVVQASVYKLPSASGLGDSLSIYRIGTDPIIIDANSAYTVTLIPEPTTVTLLALGVMPLMTRRRRA